MDITVIGPGSMGLLYGARLSRAADVTLIGNNEEHIRLINENGVVVKRGEETETYQVKALVSGEKETPADLVILFTKTYLSREALSRNLNAVGKDTILLTLQNGIGNDAVLRDFADEEHILIGTTAQGSYRENAYTIVNSGLGETVIGSAKKQPSPDMENRLSEIIEIFKAAGFPAGASDDVRYMIWNKLMINASSSVLSGVLGTNQGYVAQNEHAWEICRNLIKEICAAASKEGYAFDEQEQIMRIKNHLLNAPGGFTSIYADLKNGRKTEVDYISGGVVRAAQRHGLDVPAQTMMVNLVHAMEMR